MEVFKSVTDQLEADQASARSLYVEIISRSDTPKSGDGKALQNCMLVLGINLDEAKADAAAVLEVRSLQSTADVLEKLTVPTSEARAALRAHDEDSNRIADSRKLEREALDLAHRKLQAKQMTCSDAMDRIQKIKQANGKRKIFAD